MKGHGFSHAKIGEVLAPLGAEVGLGLLGCLAFGDRWAGPDVPQRLKPLLFLRGFMARLKPCPF